MVGVNQVTSSFVAGLVVSCGAVLVVAGASKLYRGARGADGATAMRRALRMPRHQWRRAELAVGAAELAMGVLVCSRASRVLGGVGLASFGVVFCVLLGYVRVKRIPGDCGCISWRPAPETAPEPATWRAMVRGGMLVGVGIVDVVVRADTAGPPRPGLVRWRNARRGNRPGAAEHAHARAHPRLPEAALAPDADQASRPGRARDVCRDGRLGRPVRARGQVPPDRMHRRVLVYDGDRARQTGCGIPGEPRGAGRSTCRTCIGARRPNARDNLAAPGRQRAGLARVTGGDAMRFQVMRDSQARLAAGHWFHQSPRGHRRCSGRGGMRTGCDRVR